MYGVGARHDKDIQHFIALNWCSLLLYCGETKRNYCTSNLVLLPPIASRHPSATSSAETDVGALEVLPPAPVVEVELLTAPALPSATASLVFEHLFSSVVPENSQ